MLIATDLDGTLVHGKKETIIELFDLFKKHNLTIAYVTGRDIKNFRNLTKLFYREKGVRLMSPDYLITLNGARIYRYKKSYLVPVKKFWVDRGWYKQVKVGWNRRAVNEALKATAEKVLFDNNLPALVDVKYKPSWIYFEYIVYYHKIAEIKAMLEEECEKRNTKVNVIFDYLEKKYVDMGLSILDTIDKQKANIIRNMRDEDEGIYVMMPSATNKGLAVEYIASKKGLNPAQIIAAGDGGNDYHLLTRGFNSIIVNNAHPILLRQTLETLSDYEKSNLIYTPSDGAEGLLQGLKIVLDKPFSHGGNSGLSSVINA
jgi:HAD superfamily hydrolase (TIGR01484 family)